VTSCYPMHHNCDQSDRNHTDQPGYQGKQHRHEGVYVTVSHPMGYLFPDDIATGGHLEGRKYHCLRHVFQRFFGDLFDDCLQVLIADR